MVVAILNGESEPATTPIQYLDQGKVIINEEKAKQLGITIPTQLLEQVK